jgi:RHS repeat-associated protein
MRKYYYAGDQRVAMRQGSSTVYWLLGDHLGSTAITASSSGSTVGELRYKAWGETRYSSGTTPTSFRYTGQRLVGYIELYQMGARWYDPAVSRFVSPDSIIPDFSNPQSFNRYSYGYNNPVKFGDPSGHIPIPPWIDRFAKALNTAVSNSMSSFLESHVKVSTGCKPVVEVSEARQTRAKVAGTIATTADTVATAFSGIGAGVELTLGLIPEPSPAEELSGLGIYYGIVNRMENWTSAIGTAATLWSDVEAGNTQISVDSATIGQDSLVSMGALMIGNQPVVPLEGFGDSLVNVFLLGYDANRTGDKLPTYFEFHWESREPWYLMIYLNTLPEDLEEEE